MLLGLAQIKFHPDHCNTRINYIMLSVTPLSLYNIRNSNALYINNLALSVIMHTVITVATPELGTYYLVPDFII